MKQETDRERELVKPRSTRGEERVIDIVPLAEGARIAINRNWPVSEKNNAPSLLRVHSRLTECPSVIYGPAVSSICNGLITRVVAMTLLSL